MFVSYENLKKWIDLNLVYSRGLISKKCKKDWFIKYNFHQYYDGIIDATPFLKNASLPQRCWHIINNKDFVKCANPNCNNSPTFFSFNKGYLRTCSNVCAQFDPNTISKIKSTNIKKYGTEYGLSNKEVIEKKRNTLIKNYGVDNPTKSAVVLNKIKKNNLEKYGVGWILQDQNKKELGMLNKYGVSNNTKRDEVRKQYSIDRKSLFYDFMLEADKFKTIKPLFSKEEYKGVCVDHNFLCLSCNVKFIGRIEDGCIPRCPKCFPKNGNSMFQKEVFNHIKNNINAEVIENTKKVLESGKELDIYIPELKLAIECDGLFWHGEIGGGKHKKYHLSKTEECEKLGIKLIHVFEDEWLFNKEIVKSRLNNSIKSNIPAAKIYARKCEIKEVSSKDSWVFLNSNHLQGKDNSSIKIGLYYNDELVSLMTFGKLRAALGSKSAVGEYEMYRFCSKAGNNVIGGASRLLKYFVGNYKPSKITSYADRRWSTGHLYETLGFTKISNTQPNYWYFGRGNSYKRHHRFGFRKDQLSKKLENYDASLTEWENMQLNGYDRIWDCGSIKYQLLVN
jgi:hypothetical protein